MIAFGMLACGTVVAVLRASIGKATRFACQTIVLVLVLCAIITIVSDEVIRWTSNTSGGVGLWRGLITARAASTARFALVNVDRAWLEAGNAVASVCMLEGVRSNVLDAFSKRAQFALSI